MKSAAIMNSVNVLDRISITVFQFKPGHFTIDVTAKEEGKHCVFDANARTTLENKLHEKTREMKASHPNLKGYLEEFAGKFIAELHRHDLFVIEDIPPAVEDHYAAIRNKFKRYND